MATLEDLQNDLATLQSTAQSVSLGLDALTATIADLKTQVAAGTGVTQEQLDALDAQAKLVQSTLSEAKAKEDAAVA